MAFGARENFWRNIFPVIRAIKRNSPATSRTINSRLIHSMSSTARTAVTSAATRVGKGKSDGASSV